LALGQFVLDELVATLKDQPETSISEPIKLSGIEIQGLESADVEDILDVISLLFRVWALAGDKTIEAFVEEVSEAIATFNPIGQSPETKERIRTILAIESMASLSKARAVLTDNQCDFYDAKILTDIRYAFRPDANAEPLRGRYCSPC